MNRIFKVVWSKARNCYVVASEFAKSHTKSGRAVKAVAMAAAVTLTLGVNGLVLAADGTGDTNDNSTDTAKVEIPVGTGDGLAIGGEIKKGKDELGNDIDIDYRSHAELVSDVAIGAGSKANGNSISGGTEESSGATAIGTNAHAIGVNATAIGHHSEAIHDWATAVGDGAMAYGLISTAVGAHSEAKGDFSISIGNTSVALGLKSIAMGWKANTEKDYGIAIGNETQSTGDRAVAVGDKANASGKESTAVGPGTVASGTSSAAFGLGANAKADNTTALGYKSNAGYEGATAIGNQASGSGIHTAAFGSHATAGANYSVSVGYYSNASAEASVSMGQTATASGKYSIAIGKNAESNKESAIAMGYESEASGLHSSAVGPYAVANAASSTAIGYSADAKAENATALGYNSQAIGVASVAIGKASEASEERTIAIGFEANASGLKSIAIGDSAFSSNNSTVALGRLSQATHDWAVAVGSSAKATGEWAAAFGYEAEAKAEGSSAYGAYAKSFDNHTTAIGYGSIAGNASGSADRVAAINATAVGYEAMATGISSLALGDESRASGQDSIAEGTGAIASGASSIAQGTGAKAYDNYTIAIGEGTEAGVIGQNDSNNDVKTDAQYAAAIGYGAKAKSTDALAVGHGAIVNESADEAIAFGSGATINTKAGEAIAIGYGATINQEAGKAIAVGSGATVAEKAAGSSVYGSGAWAYGKYATAIGYGAKAGNEDTTINAVNATAVGYLANAQGANSAAFGYNAKAKGANSIAQGNEAEASGTQSTAIGDTAKAYGNYTIAIGTGAEAGFVTVDSSGNVVNDYTTDVQYAAAIGYGAKAKSTDALAVGREAIVSKKSADALAVGHSATVGEESADALAVGHGATVDDKSIEAAAIGKGATVSAEAEKALAIGSGATINTKASEAIAVGYGATIHQEAGAAIAIGKGAIVNEKAARALALGSGATVSGTDNVALGAGSNDGNGVNGYTAKKAYTDKDLVAGLSDGGLEIAVTNFAGIGSDTVLGTVSVGYTDDKGVLRTRTLTNVAAGMISKDSTDAINGSQLYAVAEGLQDNIDEANALAGKHTQVTVEGGTPAGKGTDSEGDVYAGKNLQLHVTDDDGQLTYDLKLNNNLDLGESGSIKFGDENNTYITGDTIKVGDTTINNNGLTINNGPSFTKNKIDVNGNRIINVAKGEDPDDAVNVSQLTEVKNLAGKHTQVTVEGGTPAGEGTDVYAGKNLQLHVTDDDGQLTYDLKLNNNLDLGPGGSVTTGDTIINNNGITIGKGDTSIVINQGNVDFGQTLITNVKTTIGGDTNKYDVVNVEYLEKYVNEYVTTHPDDTDKHIEQGEYAVGKVTLKDGSQSQGVTIDIIDKAGNKTGEQVTITDIAKASDVDNIKEDITNINKNISNIDNRVTNLENKIDGAITEAGKHTEVTVEGGKEAGKGFDSDGNRIYNGGNLQLNVTEGKNGQDVYDVKLNNNLDLTGDGSIKFGNKNTYIDGDKINVGNTHITNNNITMGNTVITDNSLKVGDTFNVDNSKKEVTVGKEVNINMGGNQIHNVQAGTADDDAVNVSQLKKLEQNVTNNSYQINKLKGRIDKVGAGAAALAALHPLDFDPDDKFYLSAGYGHYRGENAVAVGAFYQPNDDTLFSISSTVGNDDEMINAGLTWRFGQQSHQSRSKKAMAKEIIELRTRLASLEAMIYSMAGAGLDPEKSKLFPDTPENHWAYDYVAVVAGNGILEGYPDGYFDGDRPMTRYEMAAVVYRLLQKGVQVDNRMIQEFAPELARVRVDTLTHYSDGTPHIQRVRVIKDRG